MQQPNPNILPDNHYTPSELLSIFVNLLSHREVNATVLCLNGIYIKGHNKEYSTGFYDSVKDEHTNQYITILISSSLRKDLNNGNLVSVWGTISRSLSSQGSIQIIFNVTRTEIKKDIAITKDELEREKLRRIKTNNGFKNVDKILEDKLFTGKRPQVAIIYAETAITNTDFKAGLQAAKSFIDFHETYISFAQTNNLCAHLLELDSQGYDAIALVRGGGAGLNKLDEVNVIKTIVELKTASIYGAGHKDEKTFIRNVVDKAEPIPFALGTYFRDLVNSVIQKKNNSRAILIQEVKKQYEKQIDDSNKKNKDLTKQLEFMQKQNKEQTENSNKQIAALTKAQENYEKTIREQTETMKKVNFEAQKLVKEQTETLRQTNKTLQEQLNKQTDTFNAFKEQHDKKEQELKEQISNQKKVILIIIAIAIVILFIFFLL